MAWREIEYQGIVGWVNARHLKPNSLMLGATKALECALTERFWNAIIDNNDCKFGCRARKTRYDWNTCATHPGSDGHIFGRIIRPALTTGTA